MFCCPGCRLVYQLLNDRGLCTYYRLNEHPGINRRIPVRKDKFSFLDDDKVSAGLVSFSNGEETHVTFYLPVVHCSSCLYLLERLHNLEAGIKSSRVDFASKQIFVVFDPAQMSLRALAELLTSIGYEPYISLKDFGGKPALVDRSLVYQLGVAGFCFANIMLISFPEYLGLDGSEPALQHIFRYLNLLVSLPVLLYSARPFYVSAWKGLKHRFLNIDAPIILAIGVTWCRSIWEVTTGHGAGYFDSLAGIVFFMLLGRVLQNRTYKRLAFDRDYTAYFPVAVTVVVQDKETGAERELTKTMPDVRVGDTLRIHNGELIPADGILTRGQASIDYSFVTGESTPVDKVMGELLYAGGRQEGAAIELLVVKEVAQSYLTQLWNRQDTASNRSDDDFSFVHPLSRYFTWVVLAIAAGSAVFWAIHDPSRAWEAMTAVLIVACPCALLLSATFTNGNLLRILGRNHFYLRNAEVIERIAGADHLIFDKTGTLTKAGRQSPLWIGEALDADDQRRVAALADQSTHPLSRVLAREIPRSAESAVMAFEERLGQGIAGWVDGEELRLGTEEFAKGDALALASGGISPAVPPHGGGSRVFVSIGGRVRGCYMFNNHYRDGLTDLANNLRHGAMLSVLSGDNDRERDRLQQLLGPETVLLFDQSPLGKAGYVEYLQSIGRKVMMIGDGLNDAGALRRSDVGIALTEDTNHFTPASDAILRADQLGRLPAFIRLCKAGRRVILASFVLSIAYNLVGLSFAVSGGLSPMVAAILMPSSSLTILLVTYGCSSVVARRLGL